MASLVGNKPNQVPTNGDLGRMAFIDTLNVAMYAGTGITGGTGTIYRGSVTVNDGVIMTRIIVDLTGLNSGGTAGDIIGVNATANPCHIGQITQVVNGTVFGGRMTCLEVPAGGDDDLDLYSAVEGTGVEDGAVSSLTETQLVDAGGAWTLGLSKSFGDVSNNHYLYLVGQETGNATYTAGRFLIEIFGY